MREPGPASVRGIVLDFDGTVTTEDIGDLICARFADGGWREIDQRWIRGELSLGEAQRRMWALCRCGPEEAVAYACEVGVLRAGLDGLLAAAARAGVPVWLASGGFDFYIEALLGPGLLQRLSERFYNQAIFQRGGPGGGIEVRFPHQGLSCDRCAICKGRVCALLRRRCGGPVAFIGDGHSDRCVVDHDDGRGPGDVVLAVADSVLWRTLRGRGAAVEAFQGFGEVARRLLPDAAEAEGVAGGEVGLVEGELE